ncbi:MAG: glycosyltransferase family 4 protein [Candidatus Promineifilaceae bacterium]|nr:glycosyltransferase family 4 protein [Candidatus Promineifilaceae bacterium]
MARFALLGPTYPFRGGIAHYTTMLARALAEEHDVLFISFKRQYPGWLFPGRSDRDPSPEPLRVESEPLLEPLNPLSWWRTIKRLRAWQPDVLVVPWWVPFWAPAWAVISRGVKRFAQPPRLLFICHNVVPHERGRLDRWALRAALAPGDGFITHSQTDASLLRSLIPGVPVRVATLPSYASVTESPPQPLAVQLPTDRPVLLFCGFVRPYKGLDVLLRALPLVLAKQSAHLLVAGEFWDDRADYLQLVDDLQIGAAVSIVDRYLTNAELAWCLDQASVVVLPYRTATQSAIVPLAFGRGKPVITTAVGGLPEAVDDGITGLVVPPDDHKALAAAIEAFFAKNWAEPFAANIQIRQSRFAWKELVTALISFFQE